MVEFKVKRDSLNHLLRCYFNTGKLFTVKQLSELTGESENYVRISISRMKNPKYVGQNEKIVDLVQDIGIKDKIKRWGLRGSIEYADNEKFNLIKVEDEKGKTGGDIPESSDNISE